MLVVIRRLPWLRVTWVNQHIEAGQVFGKDLVPDETGQRIKSLAQAL
jgi:hypothetical protein